MMEAQAGWSFVFRLMYIDSAIDISDAQNGKVIDETSKCCIALVDFDRVPPIFSESLAAGRYISHSTIATAPAFLLRRTTR